MELSKNSFTLAKRFLPIMLLTLPTLQGCKARSQTRSSLRTVPAESNSYPLAEVLNDIGNHLAVISTELDRSRGPDLMQLTNEGLGQPAPANGQFSYLQPVVPRADQVEPGNIDQEVAEVIIQVNVLAENLQKLPAIAASKLAQDSLLSLTPINYKLSQAMGINLNSGTGNSQIALTDDSPPTTQGTAMDVQALKNKVETLKNQTAAQKTMTHQIPGEKYYAEIERKRKIAARINDLIAKQNAAVNVYNRTLNLKYKTGQKSFKSEEWGEMSIDQYLTRKLSEIDGFASQRRLIEDDEAFLRVEKRRALAQGKQPGASAAQNQTDEADTVTQQTDTDQNLSEPQRIEKYRTEINILIAKYNDAFNHYTNALQMKDRGQKTIEIENQRRMPIETYIRQKKSEVEAFAYQRQFLDDEEAYLRVVKRRAIEQSKQPR